jgi:hypothetical protein
MDSSQPSAVDLDSALDALFGEIDALSLADAPAARALEQQGASARRVDSASCRARVRKQEREQEDKEQEQRIGKWQSWQAELAAAGAPITHGTGITFQIQSKGKVWRPAGARPVHRVGTEDYVNRQR